MTGTRPSTAWLGDKRVFVISLPKAEPPPAGTIHAGLSSDFLSLFTPLSSSSPHAPVSAVAFDDPEWADVSIEPEIRTPAALPRQSIAAQESVSDRLPDLALIPRPEELLKRPPYWLLVRQDVDDRVVVQGSHAPSLECMEANLKRWCRGNPHRVDRVGLPLSSPFSQCPHIFPFKEAWLTRSESSHLWWRLKWSSQHLGSDC